MLRGWARLLHENCRINNLQYADARVERGGGKVDLARKGWLLCLYGVCVCVLYECALPFFQCSESPRRIRIQVRIRLHFNPDPGGKKVNKTIFQKDFLEIFPKCYAQARTN